MLGLAYINDQDIWTKWGARLQRGAYEALLTPAPLKGYVENKSRMINGTQVLVNNPRVEERSVTFTITIQGRTESEYLQRYHSFVEALQSGWIQLKIPALKLQFNLLYDSCTKFGNHGLRYGKFSLRLREPDPTNRITL